MLDEGQKRFKATLMREIVTPLLDQIAKRDKRIAELERLMGGLTESELREYRAQLADRVG